MTVSIKKEKDMVSLTCFTKRVHDIIFQLDTFGFMKTFLFRFLPFCPAQVRQLFHLPPSRGRTLSCGALGAPAESSPALGDRDLSLSHGLRELQEAGESSASRNLSRLSLEEE